MNRTEYHMVKTALASMQKTAKSTLGRRLLFGVRKSPSVRATAVSKTVGRTKPPKVPKLRKPPKLKAPTVKPIKSTLSVRLPKPETPKQWWLRRVGGRMKRSV
jgi:hypothetical protein